MWEVTVPVVVVAAILIVVGYRFRDATAKRRLWVSALPYIAPVVIIALGAILRYDGGRPWVEPPQWRGDTLWVTLVANVVAVVAVTVFARGYRLLTFGVTAPSVWLSMSGGFMAGIAIGGVGP